MANFIGSYTTRMVGPDGTLSSVVSGNNCDFAIVMTNPESLASCRCAFLLASDNENFSIQSVNVGSDNQGHSDSSTTTVFQVINASQDSTITSATNGGALLDMANRYKDLYFGGETQTAASLKAFLDEKYGPHNFYCSGLGLFAPYVGFPDVYPGYPSSVELSMDYTDPFYDNPSVDPSSWTNPTFAVTGNAISWPPSLPPATTEADDRPAFRAWWIFEEDHVQTRLRFDVYVKGTQDPNVAIRWSVIERKENFSAQTVTPIVWCSPSPTLGHAKWAYVDGIYVPDETNPWMIKYANTFSGSYTKPYLTEFNADVADMPTLQRVTEYGVDAIANEMYYQMRFNYQVNENNTAKMTWGTAYGVTVPRNVATLSDITVFTAPDSENDPRFITEVVIHLGAPEDDIPDDSSDYPEGTDPTGTDPGVYNPDITPHDFDDGDPTGYDGKAILTRTYSMNASDLQNVGSKLWSQSYFNVLKIQSNPIENIVSCKWFPFSITGAQTNIKVGDVDFQYQAGKIDSIYKFTVGSVTYRPKEGASKPSYLDGSPYTLLLLHLPWCGVVELDASLMINRKITVDYVVDLITGDCVAFIKLDEGSVNYPYMSVSGHVGVDIVLTSTDRIQAEIRAASTTFSAVGSAAAGIATGNMLGAAEAVAGGAASVAGMDVTSQRSSAHSNACMTYENRNVFLEVWRPNYDPDLMKEGFKARHGWPCHKYMTLSSFSGFTKCSQHCRIDFAATSEENKMIEQLLTEGVYI